MERVNFTQYDDYPRAMIAYLRNYGPHFNKHLHDFATSNMTKREGNIERPISPFTKEEVEGLLARQGVTVSRGQLYDCVYIANMAKADFLNSSISDERHLALYIKDVIDDVDAPDGLLFNRFYADCCYKGIAIDWDEML